MKVAVLSVVASHNLINIYQRFRGSLCLHHQGDGKHYRPDDTAARTYEIFVNVYQIM